MIRIVPGAWRRIEAVAFAVLVSVVLTSCGSGGVADNTVTSGGALAITPSMATLYSDLPTTFVVSGGTGSYLILSSDQNVVPVASSLKGGSFVVVPNAVAADTPVTLTVRDANDGTLASASATLTVKPRTVSNVITITPSASQSAACGTAVCSGGDAEVKVMLSQGGNALIGREVRFDVISGDIRIITSAAGTPEVDSLSGTATTDSTGTARIRVRVLADATSQTALLRITDLSSGSTQDASVTIAPSSNAPLSAQPTSINFTGPNSSECASGVSANVIVFGGRPPYQVSQPAGFIINRNLIDSSGGSVTVTATGQCARTGNTGGGVFIPDAGQTLAIIDSSGASVSVIIHNDPAPVTPQTSAFTASPLAVTLDSCQAVANIALVGGSGVYFAASGSDALTVNVTDHLGSIQRRKSTPTNTTMLSTITVTFSDGQTTKDVTVTLTAPAMAGC